MAGEKMIKGCHAYGRHDLCPESWCKRSQGDWCSEYKCLHYDGREKSIFQIEKEKGDETNETNTPNREPRTD